MRETHTLDQAEHDTPNGVGLHPLGSCTRYNFYDRRTSAAKGQR
jgi:hypothetical protein